MKLIKTDEEKPTNTNLKLITIELKKICDKKIHKKFYFDENVCCLLYFAFEMKKTNSKNQNAYDEEKGKKENQ